MSTALGLLLRWVRGTEWRWFLDFASPAFFEVMPLGALTGSVRALVAGTRDARGFQRARDAAESALRARSIPARIVAADAASAGAPDPAALPEEARRQLGQRVLEIYFAQLLGADTALLDLRAGRVTSAGDGAVRWAPRAAWVRWDADFLAAVRDLYGGFYRDDDERFDRGVGALGLEAAAPVLRAHFGADDQRAVPFSTARFQARFHAIFVHCRDAGARLHADFLPLGIALACLYDGLEALAVPLDVRAAFEQAAG